MCTQQLTVTFEADRVDNPRNGRPQLRSHPRPSDTARLMRPAVVQSALKPHAGGVPSDRDEYSLRKHLQGPTLRPESTLSRHLWGLYVAHLSKRSSARIFDVSHSSSSCVLGPTAGWNCLPDSLSDDTSLSVPSARQVTSVTLLE